MKLYEINQEIVRLLEEKVDKETGELTPDVEKELDRLESEKQNKLVSLGLYIKNAIALKNAIREEEKQLAERRKIIERKIERLKAYLKDNMDLDKIEKPNLIISFRRSKKVVQTDNFDLSLIEKSFPDLIRIKKELDKTAAKKKLEGGIGIVGLELVETKNVQVK